MTITVLHGGQTGTDRGAHEAALDNGWRVGGYMPLDGRDERGPIPPDVVQYLSVCSKPGYGARTEENVRSCDALLVVVHDANDPRATPGTAKTIDLASRLQRRRMIVDPSHEAQLIAEWIWRTLLTAIGLMLPIGIQERHPNLMIAGPRESKWAAARVETAGLLRRVGSELHEIQARGGVAGPRPQSAI